MTPGSRRSSKRTRGIDRNSGSTDHQQPCGVFRAGRSTSWQLTRGEKGVPRSPLRAAVGPVPRSKRRRCNDSDNIRKVRRRGGDGHHPVDTRHGGAGPVRALGLQPGQRLLDVGCGWGSMAPNAARRGVRVIGVTLSREQADWGRQMIAQHGMHNLAEIRYQDYRNVTDSAFDAVSKLRAGGRLLNHCITRPTNSGPSKRGLSSIDMCSRTANSPDLAGSSPPCRTTAWTSVIPDNLREHYALTLREWSTNLREHWNACVGEVGVGTARVWGLHMAASRLAFERNAVQLHQVLAVRPTDKGDAAVRCRFSPTITALVARGERTVIAPESPRITRRRRPAKHNALRWSRSKRVTGSHLRLLSNSQG